MEKIDLYKILHDKKRDTVLFNDSPDTTDIAYTIDSVIEIMKEVWDLAVQKCVDNAELREEPNYGYMGDGDPISYYYVDSDSIEKVKEMIL